jgi:hypothetical protein
MSNSTKPASSSTAAINNGGASLGSMGLKTGNTHVLSPHPGTTEVLTSGDMNTTYFYRFNSENVTTVPFGTTGAETVTVVDAITNRSIEVVSYVVVASGESQVKFLSNTTPLTSGLTLGDNGGVSSTNNEGLVRTSDGEALKFSSDTAGTAMGGHVSYKVV